MIPPFTKRAAHALGIVTATGAVVVSTAYAFQPSDFGEEQEQRLQQHSQHLFGFGAPLNAPATEVDVVPREAASAAERQLLAKGLSAEENGADGGAYEIIDPLATNEHWIADRGAMGQPADVRSAVDGTSPSSHIIKRTALPAQSWEGLEVLDNGIVIGGDELRPGLDSDGGAIFRFVPSAFYECDGAPVRPGQLCDNTISDLSASPLASGSTYALSTQCSGLEDGQGCEAGGAGQRTRRADRGSGKRSHGLLPSRGSPCRPQLRHLDMPGRGWDRGLPVVDPCGSCCHSG